MEDLKKRRKELGLTQVEVARSCGVSINTYNRWEYRVAQPNEENEKKLKEVLKLK